MGEESKVKKKKINCFKCVYLQITWEPGHPYACRAMGFKSAVIPSLEVFRTSGEECRRFTEKKSEQK